MLFIASTTFITLALIFYTIGVWAEKISRYLKPKYVKYFWLGLLFDITGTYFMHLLSKGEFDIFEPHTFTGQLALWLMLIHAIWATWVVKRGEESTRQNFHRYSLIVWLIWLIPYFGGMYIGITGK